MATLMPPHLNETVPGRTRCRTAARAHFSPPARLFQPLPSPRAAVGDYRLPASRSHWRVRRADNTAGALCRATNGSVRPAPLTVGKIARPGSGPPGFAVAVACAAAQPAVRISRRQSFLPFFFFALFQLHSEKTCLYTEFRSVLRLKWLKDSEKTCLYT